MAGASAVSAYGARPDQLLAVARQHLRDCDGLLLVERLPETVALINPEWGERARTSLRSDNTTPDRRPARDHPAGELEAFAELTSLDMDLYRYAEQLIEEKGKAARPRMSFSRDLPEAADYTFDQPIHGHGWHVREFGEAEWYCWTDRDAALILKPASAGDHELHCDVSIRRLVRRGRVSR